MTVDPKAGQVTSAPVTSSHSEDGPKYVKVGKIKDAHGIKGELFVVIFAGEAAWLSKIKQLRFLPNDDADPALAKTLTVKSARAHKNGFIAKTNEIADRNAAELLKGWTLEIPEDLFTSKPGESIYLREIEGFKVFTKAKGEVGTITGFGSNGVQDLLLVDTPNGRFEIPFVKEFVIRIDYAERHLSLDLPEGLLGETVDDDFGNHSVNDSGNPSSELADPTDVT